MPVKKDDRSCILCRFRIRLEVQTGDELLGSEVKGSGAKTDFDVSTVVPLTVGGFQTWLWFRRRTTLVLLHSKTPLGWQ